MKIGVQTIKSQKYYIDVEETDTVCQHPPIYLFSSIVIVLAYAEDSYCTLDGNLFNMRTIVLAVQ